MVAQEVQEVPLFHGARRRKKAEEAKAPEVQLQIFL